MLRAELRHVRSLAELRRLFAALGYLPDDGPDQHGSHGVARWRAFRVVGLESAQPVSAARSRARQAAREGQRILVAALRPAAVLALAAPRIGTPHPTRVLVVPLDDPAPLALRQLDDLRPQAGATALAHALRVAEILDAETAADRFFTAFRIILDRMAGSVDRRHAERDRRMAALLSLTRVLFLYFVQAKGWLDARPDYLRRLLDHTLAGRRHFHRSALGPLCFGTLNRPTATRSRRVPPGKIPYLNGGLFEPHAVERRLGGVAFSNALWRDAFDQVFEPFRFCLREANEANAVAPDMLGRVFERLMDGGERHDTGTFYTPRAVVRQLVGAAIETALAGRVGLGQEAARQIVASARVPPAMARRARHALRGLRVLDPAAGSGAFLLGALELLTEMHLALDPRASPTGRARLKRQILERNLFGVDLNPVAVRLAELRLWLAVVADDRTNDITAVAPLPNLDALVRQGDTLLDPLGAAGALLGGAIPPGCRAAMDRVRDARRTVFNGRGTERRRTLERLRVAETRLASAVVRSALERTLHEMAELGVQARSRDLFGRRTGLTVPQQARHRALVRTRRDLERLTRSIDDGAVPGFSFETHFPEVVAAGGFDVVVGNPPWVRAERLPSSTRRALRQRFAWWRAGRRRGFSHQPDLAVAFLQRAFELAAPGGAVGMLLPSKITSAGYAETARSRLVRETTMTYVHRVAEPDARSFGATTYPLALVARRGAPSPGHRLQLGFEGAYLAQESLGGNGPWILVPDHARDAVATFLRSGRPLNDLAPPALGAKTGADALMVGREIERTGEVVLVRFGDRDVPLERSVLRPALRGRDLAPFAARAVRVLLWCHSASGAPLEHLPPLAGQYVRHHAARLRRRSDFRGGPPWTVFRTGPALAPHRVAWPDIARRPRAVVLDEVAPRTVPLNTCYVAPADDRTTALAICGVLNSTWALAVVALTADEARGGYRRVNARVVARLPIPTGARVGALAEISAVAHRSGEVAQGELDQAVAETLDLPPRVRGALHRLARDHLR